MHPAGPIPLRHASEVMTPEALGAMHQTRLSFMRALLRRLRSEGWTVHRTLFECDAAGVGRATYEARGPERTYTLVAFSKDLPAAMRSDRVIATDWDASFTLFDGVPRREDLERLAREVPLQENARLSPKELVLSRANRSVRLWDHVVGRLAEGRQPDAEMLETGYLMRTTAVYGSGKFGCADRASYAHRPELSGPFRAEMLTVWLIRAFVADLAEGVAKRRSAAAAVLDPAIRRRLGIGNSTGLGMAPFLMNHPALLNAWMEARETALARVRGLEGLLPGTETVYRDRLAAFLRHAREWRTADAEQMRRTQELVADLKRLSDMPLEGPRPWDRLWSRAELSPEGRAALVTLMLEPHGEIVDALADAMSADEGASFRIDGPQSCADLRAVIERAYPWALATDWDAPEAQARCWYVSEEKLEPRLGERAAEPIAPYERPVQPGRDAARLHAALPEHGTVAEFLAEHPEHRHAVRRAQIAATRPYAEVWGNTIHAALRPVDLLRAKLSMFGATGFDPRSDRWLRIAMYRGAPYPHELHGAGEGWVWN